MRVFVNLQKGFHRLIIKVIISRSLSLVGSLTMAKAAGSNPACDIFGIAFADVKYIRRYAKTPWSSDEDARLTIGRFLVRLPVGKYFFEEPNRPTVQKIR